MAMDYRDYHWTDPDLPEDPSTTDLGYEIEEWITVSGSTMEEQVVFLPYDTNQLRDEEFIVADQDSVYDLGDDTYR